MTVTDLAKIDFIGRDTDGHSVILTISDHLDWSDKQEHLAMLQSKLNAYLDFVVSGNIYKSYPVALGLNVKFEVVGKYPLPEEATEFFSRATAFFLEHGYGLSFRQLSSDEDNDRFL